MVTIGYKIQEDMLPFYEEWLEDNDKFRLRIASDVCITTNNTSILNTGVSLYIPNTVETDRETRGCAGLFFLDKRLHRLGIYSNINPGLLLTENEEEIRIPVFMKNKGTMQVKLERGICIGYIYFAITTNFCLYLREKQK